MTMYRVLRTVPPDLSFEVPLWQAGLLQVAGIDEAGRGAWAGPVYAAAVILPPLDTLGAVLYGVRDSKQMRPPERTFWALKIQEIADAWAVGWATSIEVDTHGIVPATRLAVHRAVQALATVPQYLLVDYLSLPELSILQTSLVKGDCRSLSIAAASVLAKTARDARMLELDLLYPGYGFARHKGYGTAAHMAALSALSPCQEHRHSFTPIKNLTAKNAKEH